MSEFKTIGAMKMKKATKNNVLDKLKEKILVSKLNGTSLKEFEDFGSLTKDMDGLKGELQNILQMMGLLKSVMVDMDEIENIQKGLKRNEK